MQTVLDILKRAGGWHPGLSLKIENQPYMSLVIEATDESGPCGLPAILVAHYGEQNGDLMGDPEMYFELGLAGGAHLNPFYGATITSAWSSGHDSSPAPTTPFIVSFSNSTSLSPKCGTTTCVRRASPKTSSNRDSTHFPDSIHPPQSCAHRLNPSRRERTGWRVHSTTSAQPRSRRAAHVKHQRIPIHRH